MKEAYARVVPEEQFNLLAEMRDELYQGRWDKMVADMEKGIEAARNPQTKYVLMRDLEIIDKFQRMSDLNSSTF